VEEAKEEEVVKELIDQVWDLYDKDNSGTLSKAETKAFVTEYLKSLGEHDRLPEA
jgi:Ca2+-binding EF-hand superfamily protein